jgi:hypothetical protein
VTKLKNGLIASWAQLRNTYAMAIRSCCQASREDELMKEGDSMTEFWLVWRNDSPVSRFRHPTQKSAMEEAGRLASNDVCGIEFFVLKAESFVKRVSPPLQWTKLDDVPF